MVTEDRKRMRGKRPCGNVKYAGQELAGDLIHVRDHKQQALRRRKRRRKGTSSERTVNGTRGAAFRLQLGDFHRLPEDILSSRRSPFVAGLRHWRGRSDRVNRADIRKRICNVRGSGITVDCLFCHSY